MTAARNPRELERLSASRDYDAEARRLPRLSPIVVDAVTDMLMTDHTMFKPPEKAAALLALITELHQRGQPFPEREVVARALNCSRYTVDSALSTRTAEGYISLSVKTEPGDVNNRASVIKRRYYRPSKRLQEIVASALRKRSA